MMATHHSSKLPPTWSPEQDRYTFQMWNRDVLLWSIANGDIEPHRQAALLLSQLRGGARELTRDIPTTVITQGTIYNGNQVDGFAFIMGILTERYGPIGEEQRLKVAKELMDFDRKPHEKIDDLLTRFEIVRHRANEVGNCQMSIDLLSYMLLRACRVTEQQFLMLTEPTGGRLPTTDAEYRNMYAALRRLGHVIENTHDNIAK